MRPEAGQDARPKRNTQESTLAKSSDVASSSPKAKGLMDSMGLPWEGAVDRAVGIGNHLRHVIFIRRDQPRSTKGGAKAQARQMTLWQVSMFLVVHPVRESPADTIGGAQTPREDQLECPLIVGSNGTLRTSLEQLIGSAN